MQFSQAGLPNGSAALHNGDARLLFNYPTLPGLAGAARSGASCRNISAPGNGFGLSNLAVYSILKDLLVSPGVSWLVSEAQLTYFRVD